MPPIKDTGFAADTVTEFSLDVPQNSVGIMSFARCISIVTAILGSGRTVNVSDARSTLKQMCLKHARVVIPNNSVIVSAANAVPFFLGVGAVS